jgi:DNA-directed RNA polymerase subunit RPC12/RpoP
LFSDLFKNSNIVDDKCSICGKNLKFKAPCCADKNAYLVCPCGYKKVMEGWKLGTNPMLNSGGSPDPTNMQGGNI